MDKNDIDLSNLMYKNDDNVRSSNVVKKQNEKQNELPEKIEKLIPEPKKEKKKDIPQKPSEDDVINKRRLILLLQFYLLEFPDKLKTFKKINLEKQDLDQ